MCKTNFDVDEYDGDFSQLSTGTFDSENVDPNEKVAEEKYKPKFELDSSQDEDYQIVNNNSIDEVL